MTTFVDVLGNPHYDDAGGVAVPRIPARTRFYPCLPHPGMAPLALPLSGDSKEARARIDELLRLQELPEEPRAVYGKLVR